MKKILGLALTIVVLLTSTGFTQSVSIVPPSEPNDRFVQNYFSAIRPGLSLNGFDNNARERNGLGLKQVLNQALNGNLYVNNKLKLIFIDSKKILTTGLSELTDERILNDEIYKNSRIVQHTAFEALASYILEKNGIDSVTSSSRGLTIRPHIKVISELKQKLVFISSNGPNWLTTHRNDYVKNVKSYQNIARAVDLYLALENAYKFWDYSVWDSNNSVLLSWEQKSLLNVALYASVKDIHDDLYKNHFFDVNEYEAEPGNRPLKGFLAAGYASLAVQNPFFYPSNTTQGATERDIFNSTVCGNCSSLFNENPNIYFNEARDKASSPATNNNSTKYWMYQSNEGSHEWAEGPYYLDYALVDAIPFWHAVRINNLLGNVDDPFKSEQNRWFLNPIEWLANVSTPDGYSPPIDDGNKFRIRSTDLLRWSDTYGDPIVGGKFATVFNNTIKFHGTQDQINGTKPYNFNDYQYLIDIAIPKRSMSSTTQLPNLTNSSDNVLIIRENIDDEEHYVLFVKEIGNSITRGEGHEQPDQMQILYYIDDHSYLVDGGYDKGDPKRNSSWNNYLHHNVMHYSAGRLKTDGYLGYVTYQNLGGLESPHAGPGRKVSEHPQLSNFNYTNVSNNIHVLEGSIELNQKHINPNSGNFHTYKGEYQRRLIIVASDDPYLIDFNSINDRSDEHRFMKMHYYGNSQHLFNATNLEDWSYWEISNNHPVSHHSNSKNLYISTISNDNIHHQKSWFAGSIDAYDGEELHILEYENKVAGSKKPYRIKRKIFGHLENDDKFGLISFLKAREFTPQNSLVNLDLGKNIHAGYYLIDNNTMDLVILRNDSGGALKFEFQQYQPELTLDTGKEFGYARLKKENGIWVIQADHSINISHSGYQFTSNQLIEDVTYPTGSEIFLGKNVILTIEGSVNINNAIVHLSENARIEVRNGGRLITDGTLFKRLDPSKQFKGVYLYTDGNSMYDSSVEGGYYGVYASNSNNNRFENTVFQNNVYGMRLWGSDTDIIGVSFKNNTYDGLLSYNSNVSIDPNMPGNGGAGGSYTRTIFENNGDNAISANFSSSISIYNSDFYGNDGHDITLDSGSRVYMGYYYSPIVYFGNNNFGSASTTRKYIYNAALTTSGETSTQWTVPARKNYWNGDTPPSSSKFHGSVDYQYALSDPAEAFSPPGDGGCTQPPCMSANTQQFNYVMSSGIAQNHLNEGITDIELDDIQRVKARLNQIIERINQSNFNPRIARWMRTAYGLVDQIEDKSLIASEINGLKHIRKEWLVRFHRVNNLEISDSLSLVASAINMNQELSENRGLYAGRKIRATQLIGEYLVALEMKRAQSRGNHTRVTNLYTRFGSYIQNKDMQIEVLGILLLSKVDSGEFGNALGILDEIEAVQPDQNMSAYWEAGDYETLRQDLQQWAEEANQEIQFKKAISNNQQELEDLPNGFTIEQAYPNPFNPNTVIPFQLSQPGKVKIEVFDVTGRMVSVLTNQNYQIGSHSVQFNATNLASGMYLVRSEILGHVTTQQITLIK